MGRMIRTALVGVCGGIAATSVAQTMQVPAPRPAESARFNCVVHLPTGGGTYYAGRKLDANGNFVSENARWVEGPPGETGKHLIVSVNWWDSNGRLAFEKGTASFWFDTDRGWRYPVILSFSRAGAAPLTIKGGTGYEKPMIVDAYVPLNQLMPMAGTATSLDWRLSGLTDKRRPGPPIIGRYAMAALREAEAAMPILIARFDAMQADYRSSCNTLR
jgi:hypothetical protein